MVFAGAAVLAAFSSNEFVAGVSIKAPFASEHRFADELATAIELAAAGISAGASAGASSVADCKTETLPVRAGHERSNAEIMNTQAAAIVSFERTDAVPRGPNDALETLLVNNAPASVLPGCSRTAPIKTMQEIKNIAYSTYSNLLIHLSSLGIFNPKAENSGELQAKACTLNFIIHDLCEAFRIEARSADQCTVNVRLIHQTADIIRFDRSAIQDPCCICNVLSV